MKIILYKFLGLFVESDGVLSSVLKKRSSEILSNGRDTAYIETVGGEFIDMNILSPADSFGIAARDVKYWNFVGHLNNYIKSRYGFKGKWGFGNKEEVTLSYIRDNYKR